MLLGTVGVLPILVEDPGAGWTSAPVYWFTFAPDGVVMMASALLLGFVGLTGAKFGCDANVEGVVPGMLLTI